jgi:hypothetical protein
MCFSVIPKEKSLFDLGRGQSREDRYEFNGAMSLLFQSLNSPTSSCFLRGGREFRTRREKFKVIHEAKRPFGVLFDRRRRPRGFANGLSQDILSFAGS